ncbi:glutathione S-transferase family protein [Myxococcota bacterium]|nr:glutathione S-transferase family protein [Myxococcota bacterium]
MKLHHVPGSRSCRVLWLLEELGGLEFEVETYRLGDPRLRSPEYRALNPAGQVPTFEDGGVAFHESGAIVQYLLERHGRGRFEPALDSPARGPYLQWLHWSEASLMPPLGQINAHRFVLREADRIPAALELARRQFARVVAQLDQALADRDYLVEDRFTAADLMAGYGIALARMVGELPPPPKALAAWFARLEQRPAFERALAGGFGGG